MGWLTVVVLASLTVLCAAGLGPGVTFALVDRDAGHVPMLPGAMVLHRPGQVLVVIGVVGFRRRDVIPE